MVIDNFGVCSMFFTGVFCMNFNPESYAAEQLENNTQKIEYREVYEGRNQETEGAKW